MSVQNAAVPLPDCAGCHRQPGSALACLACGRILPEPEGATLFQRLGIDGCPVMSREDLEQGYLRLSRLLHPDFQTDKDSATRDLALCNAALLNEAYRVLTNDQRRAEYLVSLNDPGALERHKQLDPEFLMEAMELSEKTEAATLRGDRDELRRIAEQVQGEIDPRMERVARDWLKESPDTDDLAVLLHEVRVFRRILRDVEAAA